VTDDGLPEIDLLREMIRDPKNTPHQRLRALEMLQRLRPAEHEPVDPEGAMGGLVERLCPEPLEMRGQPPDPMRDLQAAEECRRPIDPVIWTWLPYCPDDVSSAEREVLRAMRRLGVGAGPLEPLGSAEELAERRRRRR